LAASKVVLLGGFESGGDQLAPRPGERLFLTKIS